MKTRAATLLASFCLMSVPAILLAQSAPDIVVFNALVRTLDADRPTAQALAVQGDRIAAVGANDPVRSLAGPATRLIDARQRLLLPGFNDAHVHFLSGGFQIDAVDLRDARTPDEFAQRIARFSARLPQGRWVTGGDWDHESWPAAPLPTRSLIDPVTPNTPVFVNRLDGHMALANSVALKLAGVGRDTPDPVGGLIVRDPTSGEPTGILKDAAMSLVHRVIPPPSRSAKLAAARAATDHAARLGVTSVQDMSANEDIGIYQELARQGALKTRIYGFWPLPGWEKPAALGFRAPLGDAWLRVGGLKGFADGSLGSTTAFFFDPYLDASQTCGLPTDEMLPPGAMYERIAAADDRGLQVAIHAIGDRANHEILSCYERLAATQGARDRRFRIEHAQHLRPQDIARFARGGVIASMQPYHAADDGRWAEKRIGPARCQTTYPFRSLLDSGAVLAFGSDWTVAPLNPLLGVAAAVTRQTLDGRHPGGWIPDQKISVAEAVRAYTVGAAFAEFQEHQKGTLTPGKLADLVLLDRDIFTCLPEDIAQADVVLTIVNGRIVHERP